jgi:hypothetical protein
MAHYRGSVAVKGRTHEVEVDGFYFFRTSIRVDGLVVASRRPMNLSFQFPFRIDGMAVTMWWIPRGLTYDCRVIADQNVALARLDRTGHNPVPSPVNRTGRNVGASALSATARSRSPLSAEQNDVRAFRVAGAMSLALGVLMLFTGYGIKPGETYFPDGIAMGPCFIGVGIPCLAIPRALRRIPPGGRVRPFMGALFLLTFLACRIWFVPFFVERFAK